MRVDGFNTAENWSEDVSGDAAHEIRRRCDLQQRDVPSSLQDLPGLIGRRTRTLRPSARLYWG
jgi:hypothetical protein